MRDIHDARVNVHIRTGTSTRCALVWCRGMDKAEFVSEKYGDMPDVFFN
jgi:hypothetical protein